MSAALIAVAAVVVLLLLLLSASVRVAREYERGVIFRLGRLKSPPKGPGLFLLIPIIDKMVRVDLRTVTLNVPPQEVITKDNVPVRVNAVAYFRIIDPEHAIVQVENFMVATSQIAQTTLRSVLGQHMLDELLSERDKINAILQQIIDEATSPWGVKVSIVEVKDVEIPTGMQRAMARQAEAERERRAKVIAAEGEFQASERLRDAANVMSQNPITVQLRYLQTMLEISSERSSTLILPLPIDLVRPLLDLADAHRRRRQLSRPEQNVFRRDPISGRHVYVAPGRARRPGAFLGRIEEATPEELESCPFCEGREDRTPPEVLALGRPDGEPPDSPGWTVRVVPNLYPALGNQEVVVHSPRHLRTFAELDDRELELVAEAWRERAAEARSADFSYVHAMVNEGRFAGASLPHTHSQLVWLHETPPERAAETDEPCAVCAVLADYAAVRTSSRSRGSLVALAHPAGRAPYELLIAPRDGHGAATAFEDPELGRALSLLRDVVRRLRAVEGPLPWNAWLHDHGHWHLEVLPRLTQFAGLELGAGLWVNVVPPETAAEVLRAV